LAFSAAAPPGELLNRALSDSIWMLLPTAAPPAAAFLAAAPPVAAKGVAW